MENIIKIYHGDQWFNSLYFHKVPLKDIFREIREITDLGKDKAQKEEYFLSLKGEKGRKYYYVKVSPEFQNWIDKNTFTDLKGRYFEVIQQRSGKEFLDQWLILLAESQIIASYWLDYKPTKEIKEVFKIGDLSD